MERAVHLLDVADMDIYENDIFIVMKGVRAIWKELSKAVNQNGWGTTSIIPAYDAIAPSIILMTPTTIGQQTTVL